MSPVRYKSIGGSFSTALNRFKIYSKQGRTESRDVEANVPSDEKLGSLEQDAMSEGVDDKGKEKTRNAKMGHYRTQSLQIN